VQRLFGAAPQSRDPVWSSKHGPRISSAPRHKRGALRSIRGTAGEKHTEKKKPRGSHRGVFDFDQDSPL
jgi:hypothetical protein